VVDTHLSSVAHRSIFGFLFVPSQWYPLALALFLQLLMPSVSFLGHLSGLLAVGGACTAVESSWTQARLEARLVFQPLKLRNVW
jgi:hypothetical protein